ncbi:O-antigen ligase family protein [Hoeflea olei]|uniref:O-antigen ligase-related domain-containing protein n=1 Tax=Hoeflea olei TaxID=1480615 RepID=A0A1C1YTV2_9HYPH|nr:O-antigen ligase [Hoeflea olei]OCW56780.1 hypothetical protein AWJ14_17835 [Hoeflea olei]
MRHPSSSVAVKPGAFTWPPLQGSLRLARPGLLSDGVIRIAALTLSALAIALMLISLKPFVSTSMISETAMDEGSAINQVGFLAAGLVFALAMLCLTSRQVLASLLAPGFLLLALVLAYNVATSPAPAAMIRALVLTLIGMLIACAAIVLPRGEKDFRIALIAATCLTLALDYGGVIALPGLATHGYDVFEPQHAGLWRGHFSHKNIAGPVMCVIAIFGVYVMRSGQRLIGLVIFLAGALFVYKTGSKTTSGLFPLAILIVLTASAFRRPAAAILLNLFALAGVALVTLGSLGHPRIAALVLDLLGDETYTGRTTLWAFSLSKIPEHPWLGFGLYNFWSTDNVFGLDKPFEAAWDYRFIVHGHNNYLDILLNLGLLGGGVLIWLLYVAPMFNYAKARRNPNNRKLADMFFMIVVFMGLLSFLETFFLARNDPIWLMHIFAVIGLHLLARFDIGAAPAHAGPQGQAGSAA